MAHFSSLEGTLQVSSIQNYFVPSHPCRFQIYNINVGELPKVMIMMLIQISHPKSDTLGQTQNNTEKLSQHETFKGQNYLFKINYLKLFKGQQYLLNETIQMSIDLLYQESYTKHKGGI